LGLRPRLVYLVTEDWYFCSHRIDLARAARHAGYQVSVVTRVTDDGETIRQEGFELIDVDFPRSPRNPLRDLGALLAIARAYRRVRPDIIHHVALKPIVYGSLAARFALGRPRIVNGLTGLGYVFASGTLLARLLRPFLNLMLRIVLRGRYSWTILQNADDLNGLTQRGFIDSHRSVLIRGSGVDVSRYEGAASDPGQPLVLLAARLLWDKGVAEFVEAAQQLRNAGVKARFVLVGEPDEENPAAVPRSMLRQWQASGDIEWWGWRDDMPEVLRQASIVCLPSYREGLPKVLIEGAAAGRSLIATDVPGCREIVQEGVNGLLVPPRDAGRLAGAVKTILDDEALRERMGRAGRAIVEEQFSLQRVISETLSLYQRALNTTD
jgi:glycosyltransferase involved in cell wall biosynthesis